eukprot:8396237-Alexandrium_andersonii.AAC.1
MVGLPRFSSPSTPFTAPPTSLEQSNSLVLHFAGDAHNTSKSAVGQELRRKSLHPATGLRGPSGSGGTQH